MFYSTNLNISLKNKNTQNNPPKHKIVPTKSKWNTNKANTKDHPPKLPLLIECNSFHNQTSGPGKKNKDKKNSEFRDQKINTFYICPWNHGEISGKDGGDRRWCFWGEKSFPAYSLLQIWKSLIIPPPIPILLEVKSQLHSCEVIWSEISRNSVIFWENLRILI